MRTQDAGVGKTDTTERLLNVSVAPHIRQPESVRSIMIAVSLALLPALGAGIYVFGPRALYATLISVAAALAAEHGIGRYLMKRGSSIGDFSAVVTGILVAFNVPHSVPLWMPAVGSFFAIGVAKMAFGGLGFNFINPALAGRAFLMACYPTDMTVFGEPVQGLIAGIDGVTGATPLRYLKDAVAAENLRGFGLQDAIPKLQDAIPNLFWGNIGGCIGETSVFALLIGAAFLWYKRIIGFKIPFTYVATVFLLTWFFNGTGGWFTSEALTVPVYHVLAGGLMLGALFMATDMTTSPITPRGKIAFGFGCGLLTFAIRRYGGYPEGVSYSILLMNCVAPLLDRYTCPRRYGEVKSS
jgi:Na+-translocating ferredoxin:NAD+ oxidoreductase subunit D